MELIAVALSGGKDSTCALHKTIEECKNNPNKKLFGAILIDHNMRLESKKEAEEIQKYWSKQGIKVKIIRNIAGDLKNQEDARLFRLNQLSIFALKNGIHSVVLGHNLEDKLETYLFRKERFSTFLGLASISPITYINQIKFIRPLLYTSRVYIDDYIESHRLFFIEDSSNATDKYRRNQIRHHLLPSVNVREILEEIKKNLLLRRYFQRKIQEWNNLHLIQVHNFAYKFIWNRLPCDLTLAKLILRDIVHKIKGKAPNWLDIINLGEEQKNFHINNVRFIKRGDYCFVEESLSDQEVHSNSSIIIFNYKLLLWSLKKSRPVIIRNIKWPTVEINGQSYDFRHLPIEFQTKNFYCRILQQNYHVVYDTEHYCNSTWNDINKNQWHKEID